MAGIRRLAEQIKALEKTICPAPGYRLDGEEDDVLRDRGVLDLRERDQIPVGGIRDSDFGFSGFGFRVLRLRASGSNFWGSGFGFRVSVFGFRVSGFGFSGFGFRVLGLRVSGFRALGLGFEGFGLRVLFFGARVSGFGFRVSGFGFRVSG